MIDCWIHRSIKWWKFHLISCWLYAFVHCKMIQFKKRIWIHSHFIISWPLFNWSAEMNHEFYLFLHCFSYMLYHNHSFSSNNCLWTLKSRDIFSIVGQYSSFQQILKSFFDKDFCFFSCVLFCDMVWYGMINSDMNCFNFSFSLTKAYFLFNLLFNSWYPIYSNPSIVWFELFEKTIGFVPLITLP